MVVLCLLTWKDVPNLEKNTQEPTGRTETEALGLWDKQDEAQ